VESYFIDILYLPSTGYFFGNLMTSLNFNIMGRSTDYRRLLSFDCFCACLSWNQHDILYFRCH